ncbi:uncharacterized protein [Ranitomeya imitator]|uniref:uncharacterized protein isoform X2 n=1 Tax=Ranitomeya imitator TaxID=111125 RepID=UPI0037E83153
MQQSHVRRRHGRHRRLRIPPRPRERAEGRHCSSFYPDLRRSPEGFMSFCRLTVTAFDNMMEILRPDLTCEDPVLRPTFSAEERLLLTLRFLATGESFASLHLRFRVEPSAISNIVGSTCSIVWQKLQPIVMPSPTEETWRQVAAGFQTVANFPNCIGAVDGNHVRVIQPPRSGPVFFHDKEYFSMILMAVADARYKFVAFEVDAHGTTGDSRVFRTPKVGVQILPDGVMLPAPQPLPGTTHPVPFVMVSRDAFPLETKLLRPYSGLRLNDQERIFNFRLSRARRVVDCTFSLMVNQWRILNTAIHLDIGTVESVIKACCVLHNYGRDYGPEVDVATLQPAFDTIIDWGPVHPNTTGVRETFVDYFMSSEGAVPWQYSCVGGGAVESESQTSNTDSTISLTTDSDSDYHSESKAQPNY